VQPLDLDSAKSHPGSFRIALSSQAVPVVDCQSHWYPRAFFEALYERDGYPRARREEGGIVYDFAPGASLPIADEYVDLELQLERLAAAGVDQVVSSPASFGVHSFPAAEGRHLAEILNAELADAQQRHAGRFHGLATLPLQDEAAALAVLDAAASELRGVHIPSNVDGEPLDSPRLRPVWSRIAELGLPAFIHPARTIFADRLERFGLEYVVGYVFDTTVAALSLVFGGVLDELPGLRIVHPHLGGTIPYLAGRIDHESAQPWAAARKLERAPSEYLAGFYTDTVSRNPAALAAALAFYGGERVLLGTDYPWWPPEDGVALVRDHVPEVQRDAVLGANAQRLLGI
jgi:predicted TIM-barrel fold metal-dependent hydrolase